MLGGLLHISINGREIEDSEYDSMMQSCCNKFKSMKKRKKLPNQLNSDLQSLEPAENITLMEDASMQV